MPDQLPDTSTPGPVAAIDQRPRKKEEVTGLVRSAFEFCSRHRDGLNYRIKEARHFLGGDQWIQYMPYQQRFTHHAHDDWHPTPVTNYLVKHYDRQLDIYTSGEMWPKVSPASDDQDDIDASFIAQNISHSEFRRLRSEARLLLPAASWTLLAGNVFLGAHWDAQANKIKKMLTHLAEHPVKGDLEQCPECGFKTPLLNAYDICPDCGKAPLERQEGVDLVLPDGSADLEMRSEPLLDEHGNQQFKELSMGDVVETVASPLEMYPMPVENFDDARYIIRAQPMHTDEIKQLFGSKAAEVVAENLDFDDFQGAYNTKLSTVNGMRADKQDHDHAMVYTFEHIPDKRKGWKEGATYIIAGEHILHEGKLGSTDGKLPWQHIKYRHLPGLFWGASPFTDLIQQQKRTNSVDSHIVQHRKQMINAQWLVPQGAGISQVDGRAGLIIRWNPHMTGGMKPERQAGVPMPPHVLEERRQTLLDMQEIAGDTEGVLSGNVPPGPETGPAIEHLMEQAFRRFGPSIKLWRAGLSEHYHRVLMLVNRHWSEERVVRVIGDNHETEVFHYAGAQIDGVEDMIVRTTIGALFSDTAKQQKVLQALSAGLLNPQDPIVRGRALEKMGIEGFDFQYIGDAKKARRILKALKEGQPPPELTSHDDHGVIYSIIREFIITVEFEKLPDQAKQAIGGVADQLLQMVQQKQMQQLQQAQALKGTGSETQAAAQAQPETQKVGA